ncbi:MAG: hypothetical protein EB041_02630, partial [Proteobacteria bacterium]|nr:hypothetical protein [Pseudomonadota bacterium]
MGIIAKVENKSALKNIKKKILVYLKVKLKLTMNLS